MKKMWIDPPSGWKYGFPKLWDGESDISEWMIENGYPKETIEKMKDAFYYRAWYSEEELENE